MPIFDPSQFELWGYSLPTDPAGKVRTLSTNTAGHIARLLQTLGLDKASFESTVTFPDGMTLHYMGGDATERWGYPIPTAVRRAPTPEPPPPTHTPAPRTDIEWAYSHCSGAHDLGRYIFTESRAGCLDVSTWAFPVAYAMGWSVDRVTEQGTIAHFYFDTFDANNTISKGTIRIEMSPFEFVIDNDIRSYRYDTDLKYLYEAYRMCMDGELSEKAYRGIECSHTFQFALPKQMDHYISHIQSVIDESLREVSIW